MEYITDHHINIFISPEMWDKVKSHYCHGADNLYPNYEFVGDFESAWGLANKERETTCYVMTTSLADGWVKLRFSVVDPTADLVYTIYSLVSCLIYVSDKSVTHTSDGHQQLMLVTGLGCDWRNCVLHVQTSWQFRKWLGDTGEKIASCVRTLILDVMKLNHSGRLIDSFCSVTLSPEQIIINLPEGDAPFLASGERIPSDREEGFALYLHNIDYLYQLFALIAAIAFLWGKARKELYGADTIAIAPPSP